MRSALFAICAAALLGACSAQAPLPPKSATVPTGMDLSGQWRLRDDSQQSSRQITDAERRVTGADESLVSGRKVSQRRSSDVQVHVFLEAGEDLKVTQTEHGLFISFDRSVVEEYRFGEQRTVRVGPVEADRVSGWENRAYVIETRDKEGAMLIESYRLDGSDSMVRTIRIVHQGQDELNVNQVFERR